MGRKRHTPEQIITALREAEVGLARGKSVKLISRERFGLRHTSDEAFGMSGLCFAEHGFPAGNDLIGVPEVDLLGG